MMKMQLTHYKPGIPPKSFYQQGVDYLQQEFDLEFEDALYLLKELKNHRDNLWVDAPSAVLDFYIEDDGSLWVEIYGLTNSLWAISEIDLSISEEILSIAYEGEAFGEQIPTTDRTWDAYSGI